MYLVQQFISTCLHLPKQTLFKSLRRTTVMTSSRAMATPPGKFVDVDGLKIHYEQVGHGDHVVLFMPGAVGSSRLDFGPLEKMDPDKFTVLAWDPPGYGFSRPPDRTFPMNFFERDAKVATKFIKALGISKLSVTGWCNGGSTAVILASQNPNLVNKLVVYGCHVVLGKDDLEWNEKHRDIMNWNKIKMEERLNIYGEKYFQDMWRACLDSMNIIYDQKNGDICATEAKLVTCPTLLLHGTRDTVVSRRHFEILANLIKHAETFEIEGAHHWVAVEKPDEFYNVVQSFLLK